MPKFNPMPEIFGIAVGLLICYLYFTEYCNF